MTTGSLVHVTLTDVGEGLAEAEIVRWLVAEGDMVAADQPIVEVETDKSVIELPAPVAGMITSLVASEGDVVEIGAELASIEPNESNITDPPGRDTTSSESEPSPATPSASPAAAQRSAPRGRVLASPANRRRALELGLDLLAVRGSGPGGRITAEDIQRAARHDGHVDDGARADEAEVVERRLGVRRRAVAETMTRSWREIPHITEFREIDVTALVEVRRRLAARLQPDDITLTFTPLLALSTIAALRRHPELHATLDLDAGRALLHRRCHLGVAVATDEGLVVPVLANADRMGVRELAVNLADLAAAAHENRLHPHQVKDGTFTISNFGSLGVWLGTPIIRPPEVAIAGFGRIRDQVIAEAGVPVVRPVLPIAVSADHRMVDGDKLARFVTELEELLSDPVLLLAETD